MRYSTRLIVNCLESQGLSHEKAIAAASSVLDLVARMGPDPDQDAHVAQLVPQIGATLTAQRLGISRSSVYRALDRHRRLAS